MKIGAIHSHMNGYEWLAVHEKAAWDEIGAIIGGIDPHFRGSGAGRTVDHKRRAVSSQAGFRQSIAESFRRAGWKETSSGNGNAFMKARVAVEVPSSRSIESFCDLVARHLAFYVGDAIDVGIEILPMKAMQEEMSSGPGYFEGCAVRPGPPGPGRTGGAAGVDRGGAVGCCRPATGAVVAGPTAGGACRLSGGNLVNSTPCKAYQRCSRPCPANRRHGVLVSECSTCFGNWP